MVYIFANQRWFLVGFSALALVSCDGVKRGNSQTEKFASPKEPERAIAPSDEPKERTSEPPQKVHTPNLPPLEDKGIFPDLDARLEIQCPKWLAGGPHLRVVLPGSSRVWRAIDGVIVCEEPPSSSPVSPLVHLDSSQDQDGDQIPDSYDLLRGAKKAVLNAAHYQNHYIQLAYPGGDVPRSEGVCTDVLIRSLRNTGSDLQSLLFEDIQTRPGAYPMVKKADPHIDHRRVRTLLPYLKHAFTSHPTDPRDSAYPYFPGDILLMNTAGDAQPEHLGIVSDRLGPSGLPLIINNWTEGTQSAEMDLLAKVPVTHRFRHSKPVRLPKKHQGLEALLLRRRLELPPDALQVISVTAPLWRSSGGWLQRWERSDGGPFHSLEPSLPVRIGSAGLGTGLGLHKHTRLAPSTKAEGDKKAPAGVFRLGTAFGREQTAPHNVTWPYRTVNGQDYWVDDSGSPDYNTWQRLPPGKARPWSAESLTMYSLALVVEHNTKSPRAGSGSAIFLHPWKSPASTTLGCTALDSRELTKVLAWLSPGKHPVLVQVAGHLY